MGARGPKPGFKRATAQPASTLAVSTQAAKPAPVVEPVTGQPAASESPRGPGIRDSLQRGRRIDQMDEAELRSYAKLIGISQRDCSGLSVDRLRQNCALTLASLVESCTE